MTGENLKHELPMEFLTEFQDKLRSAEEKYRSIEDSAVRINGLLEELAMFYDADRAFLVEIDWDLGVGVCTHAYCHEGIESQLHVMQHIPVEKFMSCMKKIKENQPVIIDVEALDPQANGQYNVITWNGLNYVMIAPFSNRVNAGIIGIGNPTRYRQNLSFMLVLGYAIVSELNKIRLQERVDVAVRQISHSPMTEIYVTCFGGLEIKSQKGVLIDEAITADQCYRLLAYLLCNYKKTRPVRELADIIWNDAPINDPYKDLKNVVYRLKRFLSIIELEDLVIGSGGTFVINPKYHLYTDYERFEDACNRFFNETRPELQSSAFQTAKEMYRGSLLPRCDHIHWFIPRIGYYQTLYLRLMKTYISQRLTAEDYLTVQRAAYEGLEVEPYDTDFMTYQVVSMYAQGNRSHARNYFNRIKSELTDEQKTLIDSYWR